MAEHKATVRWALPTDGDAFLKGRYSREHTWTFDGGVTVPASPSPSVVPVPYSSPAGVDPEEAFVASIASCHMLTFLYVAMHDGFVVQSYEDDAVGVMRKNERGAIWVAAVTLHPRIAYGGEKRPTAADVDHLHHLAHEQCFIANSVKTEITVGAASGMSGLTILFDLDGTLTDSRAGITASLRHALERLGRECPADDVLATFIGPPLRGTLSTLLGTSDPVLVETALAHYRARYDEVGLFENAVYDGVPEMLEGAARLAGPMFVATAKTRHAATRIVAHFELARHFHAVYGAEPGGRFDRKVDLLGHLIETGVIRAESSVMVGDRDLDIAAARAHRIRSIGALWGFGDRRELTDAGADLLCESPRALVACLARAGA